jgi:hypothetical protein
MSSAAEKIVAEALRLGAEERAQVAERLLESLEDDGEDARGEDDRRRLHEAIARSEAQFAAGQGVAAEVVLADLESRLPR